MYALDMKRALLLHCYCIANVNYMNYMLFGKLRESQHAVNNVLRMHWHTKNILLILHAQIPRILGAFFFSNWIIKKKIDVIVVMSL